MPSKSSSPVVVVIDDDALQLRVLSAMLDRYYTVFTANRGVDAINILENCAAAQKLENVHAILLDIMMPNVDGFALLQFLRRKYPTIPIIMCSALNQKEHILKAMALGAKGYLLKPFKREVLLQKLMKVQPPHRGATLVKAAA